MASACYLFAGRLLSRTSSFSSTVDGSFYFPRIIGFCHYYLYSVMLSRIMLSRLVGLYKSPQHFSSVFFADHRSWPRSNNNCFSGESSIVSKLISQFNSRCRAGFLIAILMLLLLLPMLPNEELSHALQS